MSNVARRSPVLAKLALTGALAGSLVSVAGCHWLLWSTEHEAADSEVCDEAYRNCLEWAVSAQEVECCEEDVMLRYGSCEGTWEEEEDDGDDGDDGGDDGVGSPTGGSGGSGGDGGD